MRSSRGLIEEIVEKRFGKPTLSIQENLIHKHWTKKNPEAFSKLYFSLKCNDDIHLKHTKNLKLIYGDAIGGFFIGTPQTGGDLRIAMLNNQKIFGLYRIKDLQLHENIQKALSKEKGIDFFMDDSNILYYGCKNENLYIYDSETDELDSLGPLDEALEKLIIDTEISYSRLFY